MLRTKHGRPKRHKTQDTRHKTQDTRHKTQDGFTLIEVLIVVVIIGVLAALVIPRMIGSSEKAKMAEAYQMIGSLIRAQQTRMDTTGLTTPVSFMCNAPPGACNQSASLGKLGMADIRQKEFHYACAVDGNGDYCVASRWLGGQPPLIGRYYTGAGAGKWFCYDGYVTADGGGIGLSDVGCQPNW